MFLIGPKCQLDFTITPLLELFTAINYYSVLRSAEPAVYVYGASYPVVTEEIPWSTLSVSSVVVCMSYWLLLVNFCPKLHQG